MQLVIFNYLSDGSAVLLFFIFRNGMGNVQVALIKPENRTSAGFYDIANELIKYEGVVKATNSKIKNSDYQKSIKL